MVARRPGGSSLLESAPVEQGKGDSLVLDSEDTDSIRAALHLCRTHPRPKVEEITRLYRVYHSSRYVKDSLVLRLQHRLPDPFLGQLRDELTDIMDPTEIIQRDAFPVERDEKEIFHLPRLAFPFNCINLGGLRMMIDRINSAPLEEPRIV